MAMVSNSLLHASSSRENNLNLIRFVAASAVLISHSFALSTGDPSLEPLRAKLGITLGTIAVDIFFVASGFLIAASMGRARSIANFFRARFLRVFPGLWVAIVASALLLGPAVSDLTVSQYFHSPGVYRYLIKNGLLVFGVEYDLPGVFAENPYPRAVNGSLWTLPYELKCYFALALAWSAFGFVSRAGLWRRRATLLIAAGFVLALLLFLFIDSPQPKWIRLGAMFSIGAFCESAKGQIRLLPQYLAGAMVLIVAAALLPVANVAVFHAVYYLLIGYVVLAAAYLSWAPLLGFNKLGDYSYGIYVYAFPIQQLLAHFWVGITVGEMLACSFALTLLVAIASWRLVEAPALRFK